MSAYRPQFFYRTPPGYVDIPFVRPVTEGQDASGGIPQGQSFLNYVVQMDYDAPQIIRSIFFQGVNQGQGAGVLSGSMQVQVRDPRGYALTDGYVPFWLYMSGAGNTPQDGGSGRCKVFESEVYCDPGSLWLFDFFAPGSSLVFPGFQYPGLFELRGVKRYKQGCI